MTTKKQNWPILPLIPPAILLVLYYTSYALPWYLGTKYSGTLMVSNRAIIDTILAGFFYAALVYQNKIQIFIYSKKGMERALAEVVIGLIIVALVVIAGNALFQTEYRCDNLSCEQLLNFFSKG